MRRYHNKFLLRRFRCFFHLSASVQVVLSLALSFTLEARGHQRRTPATCGRANGHLRHESTVHGGANVHPLHESCGLW